MNWSRTRCECFGDSSITFRAGQDHQRCSDAWSSISVVRAFMPNVIYNYIDIILIHFIDRSYIHIVFFPDGFTKKSDPKNSKLKNYFVGWVLNILKEYLYILDKFGYIIYKGWCFDDFWWFSAEFHCAQKCYGPFSCLGSLGPALWRLQTHRGVQRWQCIRQHHQDIQIFQIILLCNHEL